MLMNYIELNGGATYDYQTNGLVEKGISVAIQRNEFITDTLSMEIIDKYVEEYIEFFKSDMYKIGFWLNPMNNLYYLDTVRIFNQVGEALTFAKNNNQIAIYDLTNGETIYVENCLGLIAS